MLVVFKSAPILKRTLKVKHAMLQVISQILNVAFLCLTIAFQLYVLKLLKMQTKYLGRQWRKSNMKTMSAIYTKVTFDTILISYYVLSKNDDVQVRHRLNDDWAFGNDVDSRPWDFQANLVPSVNGA